MSFYNSELNALFIHVPKTAGTSIKRTGLFLGGTHQTIRDFSDTENFFTFAFVRNPWDRFVSSLFFHREYRNTGQKGFDEFIEKECIPSLEAGKHPHSERLHAFVPMHYYLLDSEGDVGVDYIGRFESLEHDWREVCDTLGTKYRELAHHRKFKHDHYESYYTPESWEIVGSIYKRDVELFGYGSEA